MKKIILLVFVTLFCCVGYSQAQTTKKMTRQEKKEAQKAMEQALFEEARQAIENKAFTLRSEERRVGKECHKSCRSRWSPDH